MFDKTGTLTRATPQVVQVVPFSGCGEQEVLRLSACLEEHFHHSMANAVVRAAKERGISHEEMHSEVEYIVAHGIASRIGGKRVVIGSAHFIFEDESCTIPAEEQAKFDALDPQYSHLYLAVSGVLAGVICIADPLRPEAAQVGVDRCFAEVLPEDKAAYIERLTAEPDKSVAFVGDGMNDAPVLALSDVGIAMGGLGSDAAIESADVVIQTDQPSKVAEAISIGRATRNIVRQNIVGSIGVKVIVLVAGAFGFATLWEAVFADVGVSLLAVLNSIRILKR